MEIYLRALRDGYFVPWVKDTRLCDVRGFSLTMAKVALKYVLISMRDGSLAIFNLNIIFQASEGLKGNDDGSNAVYSEPQFAIEDLCNYLLSLEPVNKLVISYYSQDGTDRLSISRESLLEWIVY